MSKTSISKVAAAGFVFGFAFIGTAPMGDYAQVVQAAQPASTASAQARLAKSVKAAMLKGKIDRAVGSAEQLVALSPQNAGWRQLLGETYLSAGRFQSAATSFNDALTLNPASSVSALKLALSLAALGDVNNARSLLESHKTSLSAADYGLAVALTGDPQAAVQWLEAAVRGGAIDSRTRQNLALSYALSGRWVEARVTAAQDVSPDQLDQRMTEWAALSRPRTAWDQVAGVLGVKARLDRGQPAQIALNAIAQQPVQVAAAEPAPVVSSHVEEPVQLAMTEPQPLAETPPQPEFSPAIAPQPKIVMAPRREVVQPIPESAYREKALAAAPMIKADRRPAKQPVRVAAAKTVNRLAAAVASSPVEKPERDRFVKEGPNRQAFADAEPAQPRSTTSLTNGKTFKNGQFAVQLGAFVDKASAQAVWTKVSSKVPGLASHKPMTSRANVKGKIFTRLASAGFPTRDAAEAACGKVRAAGQECFIRTVPAQELAQWVALDGKTSAPVKLAQRKAPAPAKPVKVSAKESSVKPKAPARSEVKIASR